MSTAGERFLAHFEGCSKCRPWSPCAEAAKLLQSYTAHTASAMAPRPVIAGKA